LSGVRGGCLVSLDDAGGGDYIGLRWLKHGVAVSLLGDWPSQSW
jgi:hypothetical protein